MTSIRDTVLGRSATLTDRFEDSELASGPREVVLFEDSASLILDAAHRLVARLEELNSQHNRAQLCLTGGRIANRVYNRVADLLAASDLAGNSVEFWWSDDNFVPTDAPQRHAGEALAALAGQMRIDASLVHPMPAAGGSVTLEIAASNYATELGDTVFDICLLGLGSDGHIASLFPEHPASLSTSALVTAVSHAPDPPHERLSLTLNAINRSKEVWFLVSGEDKADAVAAALRPTDQAPLPPAARVLGTEQTLWLLDEAAAAHLAP